MVEKRTNRRKLNKMKKGEKNYERGRMELYNAPSAKIIHPNIPMEKEETATEPYKYSPKCLYKAVPVWSGAVDFSRVIRVKKVCVVECKNILLDNKSESADGG